MSACSSGPPHHRTLIADGYFLGDAQDASTSTQIDGFLLTIYFSCRARRLVAARASRSDRTWEESHAGHREGLSLHCAFGSALLLLALAGNCLSAAISPRHARARSQACAGCVKRTGNTPEAIGFGTRNPSYRIARPAESRPYVHIVAHLLDFG